MVLDSSPTVYSVPFPPLLLNSIACNLDVLHPEPHTKLYNIGELGQTGRCRVGEEFLTISLGNGGQQVVGKNW